MKKMYFVILVFLLTFPVLPFFLPSVNADADVVVVSSSYWPDRYVPKYYLTGEVENIGDSPAGFVWINATFYDEDDQFLFYKNNLGIVSMGVILPGHKAPFLISADVWASDVDYYTFEINFQNVEAIPIGLELISSNQSVDENEKLTVTGEVKNIGGYTAISPWIQVTYYDSEGTVVNMRQGNTSPEDIEPNQIASFTIESPWWLGNANDLVDSYSITAVCDQFVLIPEFSPLILSSLFLILTLIATIGYRKKLRN